jgi:hypothetical protein
VASRISAGPTKTHGRIRSRQTGRSVPTRPAEPEEQEPDPADADAERDAGQDQLGEELVALAVAQILGP